AASARTIAVKAAPPPQLDGTARADAEAPSPAVSVPWSELIEKLGLSGMSKMLARHCELVTLDAKRVELRLPRLHERLLEKTYQEKLKSALQKHFNSPLQLTITLGEANG